MKVLGTRLFLGALAGLLSACSMTLDFGEQCVTNSDCASLGTALRCEEGLCIARSLVEDKACSDCEPTSNCDRLYGADPTKEPAGSVVMLGAILPRSGALATYGDTMDRAIQLATNEINLAGGVLGRKLSVLSCDSASDTEQSKRAARHLVETAQVSAVIGDAGSTATIDTFNSVLRPAGVLMMSPSATSPMMSQLADDNLLWRTAPSDAIQGLAIAKLLFYEFICPGYATAADPNKPFRIGLAYRNDAYGTGLANRIRQDSCSWGAECVQRFNCANNLKSVVYDPEGTNAIGSIERAVSDLKAYEANVGAPLDLVILIGYADDASAFIQRSQGTNWQFVLTDGMRDGAVFAKLPNLDQNLMCNALGTAPASPDGTSFLEFSVAYDAFFRQNPGPYAAHAYDALYLVAHGAASAIGEGEVDLSGQAIARGIARLSDPTSGPAVSLNKDFQRSFRVLSESRMATLNVEGASGSLDFDNSTGDPSAGINIWRYDLNQQAFRTSSIVIDASDDYVGGVLQGLPAQCSP